MKEADIVVIESILYLSRMKEELTGKILRQMKQMKKDSPAIFAEYVKNDMKLDMIGAAKFRDGLDNLH